MGVPIAMWPMASDQPRNVVLITSLLKVGVVVTSSTVENAEKTFMESKEGDEIRQRAVDMGETVRRAMDKVGVSCLELDSSITQITRKRAF